MLLLPQSLSAWGGPDFAAALARELAARADDPTPASPQQEYCELDLAIDKASAAATVALADGADA
jgi:hypothetical protein